MSWVWVAQIVTMALQLVYAGFTSRAIDPAGFGTFAVALTVTALGGMLANSGLANAAARRQADDVQGDRAIVTAALAVGLVIAGAFAITAPLWSRLWGNPEATTLIRILCIGLVAGSYANALAGVARRLGRMGIWTAATFASALVGMGVGGLVAFSTRAPWSLTVMPVTSSAILGLILLVAIRRRGLPTSQLANVGQDLVYGAKSLGSSLLTYVAYGLPTWSMSRWLGASTFGSWNRAVVVGQVPLESAARAVITVIFPRFRWDGRGGENVRRRWSSLLASTALVVLPLVALVIPAVPTLIRILLGPQWTEAGVMAQFILAATAVNVLNSLLGMALQASNNFRAVWLSQVAIIVVLTAASAALVALNTWIPLAVGYLIAAAVSHAVQARWATTARLLESGMILKWYLTTTALVMTLWVVGWAIIAGAQSSTGVILLFALASGCTLGAMFLLRKRIEPFSALSGNPVSEGEAKSL